MQHSRARNYVAEATALGARVSQARLFFNDTARVMYFSALRRTWTGRVQRAHMNCTAVHIAASALFVPYERDRSDRTNIVRSDPDRFGSVLPGIFLWLPGLCDVQLSGGNPAVRG